MTKSSNIEADGERSKTATFVLRFTLAGAVVGLVVGLSEAALLYTIPRVPILLQPDVRYVIWFLSPLVGLVGFGFLGFFLGLALLACGRGSPWKSATLTATGLAVAGAYLSTSVALIQAGPVGTREALSRATPWVAFGIGFVGALVSLRVLWGRVAHFFDKQALWPLGRLVMAVAMAVAVTLSGMAFYLARRPLRLASVQANSPQLIRRPNVVLLTLDAVRADHVSAYGYSRPTTPNLDRLAAQGVLFGNAVAASSWTIPSHISMFTALLPHQHGANFYTPIDTSPWTLAEVLQARGYETAGFTSNLGVGYAGWGMGQGFEVYEDDSSSLRHNLASTLLGRTLVQSLYRRFRHYDRFDRRDASEVNRDVFSWIRNRSARPFFLFINYFDAHDPYWAPPPYDGRFGRVSNNLVQQMNSPDDIRSPKPLSAQDRASLVAGYDNCLAFLDEQVGRLMDFLGTSPELSNTVVIVTSDHGKAFGEHGHYNHGRDLYREMLHVPLIVVGPGIPRGQGISHIAQTREIFPTVLDLTLGEQGAIRRSSLRRFWTPGFNPEPFDEMAASELSLRSPDGSRRGFISLMTSEWHYIQNSEGHSELFHWPTDPQETTNLVDLPEHADALQILRERLYESVALSTRPWRGSDYLLALDRPGYSFLREVAFDRVVASNLTPLELRVGSSQSYFPPGPLQPARPLPADEDLIKTLPYH